MSRSGGQPGPSGEGPALPSSHWNAPCSPTPCFPLPFLPRAPSLSPDPNDAHDPFSGAGEVAALGRELDWANTSLGPPADWSPAVRTAVRAALASPFPINLWCGPELNLVYNDAYAQVLGVKHPDALGRPGPEVWSEIWPDIEPMFEQIRAGGPPVYEEEAPFVVRRDEDGAPDHGPNAWFTFGLSPVRDENGELVAFLNIVHEATRRMLAERESRRARIQAQRAEERLREIFAQAPSFMAVVSGPNHVLEYVNDAYRELVGDRELLGRPLLDALPEVRGQGYQELLDGVLETGEPYVGRERPVELIRGEDEELEERWVDLVYYPIVEADDTVSGIVAHGSDVTEHVRSRKRAERALAEAREANEAKSRFLATVSHELRTPINAIVGYADLLGLEIDGSLTDGQRAHLERLETSGRHLLMLVDNLLALTGIEGDRIEVMNRPFEVASMLDEAVSLVAPQAEAKGVEVGIRPVPEGLSALADPERARQILVNLLANALKFTPEDGTVEVRAEREGERVLLAVEDSGTGIAAEVVDDIFEPFFQVDQGLTRGHSGAGLGLAISRRLADLMDGELRVESTEGEGSTFTLVVGAA